MLLSRGLRREITSQLSSHSATTIAKWIGCYGVVWNLKVADNKEALVKYYANQGAKPIPNQKVAPLIDDSRPWLREVPSQIRRNSASEWMKGMQAFFRGRRGLPRFKDSNGKRSCLVTKELFVAEFIPEGVKLSLRATENSTPFCEIVVKTEKATTLPNQIWLSRVGARFFVSFSYEYEKPLILPEEILAKVKTLSPDEQESQVLGCDLGVEEPVVLSNHHKHKLTPQEEAALARKEKRRLKYQRRLSRQKHMAKITQNKTGKNYQKTKAKLSKSSAQIANVRHNFSHHASKACAENVAQIVVCEDLKIKNMTKRPKAKQDPETGKWQRKGACAKAGLNRAILSTGWGIFLTQLEYKLHERDKLLIKIPPHYSSQECCYCGHTEKANRKTRDAFSCLSCGHQQHADINAAQVLKKRFLSDLNAGTFVLPTKTVKRISCRKKTARIAGLVCGADVRSEGFPSDSGCEAETSSVQA